MAVRIKFDGSHNPIQPSIILATRRGRKIGKLPAMNLKFKDSMNNGYDMSFTVNQSDCQTFWSKITDLKLVWVKEWNRWFEIEVNTEDTGNLTKNVTAISLGKAELSQIKLYNKEINTEDDISRDDYEPTVFYNPENPSASLLHRLLDKAPHYCISHIDTSLINIQRSFSFNDKTVYDSLMDVAKEIKCLIRIECITGENGKILRQINAYDLKSVCLECGTRGDFVDICSHCGSHNINEGYGEDTSIFISTENLADNIKYSTDNGSVKNCFRLEAGDDLMTAAVVSCNPNGSAYIWNVPESMRDDMSEELVKKLEDYDKLYSYYQKEHHIAIPDDLLNSYNSLVEKYSVFTNDYKKIGKDIVGYPALMQSFFDTIDFEIYLTSGLMPAPEMIETTAQRQIENISTALLYGVSVKNLDTCSASTAESAVLGIAKAAADNRYQIRISDSVYIDNVWSGIIRVTNASNEEDTAISSTLSCVVNDDYAGYVKQKILKMFDKSTEDAIGIDAMFKLSDDKFIAEMQKYCLSRLRAFYDICQSCLDILIEHGIADKSKWAAMNEDLYESIYVPYYKKLHYIEDEIKVRENEIAVVSGTFDAGGELVTHGMKSFVQAERDNVQNNLNFDEYLGEDCLMEFSAYRREDTYSNSNYISDGLNNSELFQLAQQFMDVARSEIYKSSTLQHTISAKLKNMLAMKEFEIIVDYFEIGNWIRVKTDGKLCKLRLIEYEISFDDFKNIDVDFSDMISTGGAMSDIESVLNQASSMATSYETVARQAKQGKKSNAQLTDWVERGLDLTKMRIIDSADNQNISWDSHGILCKEYLPIMDTYDDKQLKIINRGLYLTDDGWKSSKAGIGDFTYWNPKTGKMEESYGVIADVIVGNIILSEEVGIYNQNNSVTMNQDGLVITANPNDTEDPKTLLMVRRQIEQDGVQKYEKLLYLDDNGYLVLNGSVRFQSTESTESFEDVNKKIEDVKDDIGTVKDRIDGFNGLFFYIRYSEFEDGSNMTEAPNESTKYLGTCNTDEKTAPTDPKSYTWTKIKGDTGFKGEDGTSQYLHIRYSNDGSSFTANEGTILGDWIGVCVTETDVAPTEFNAYQWSKFNGTDGINTAVLYLYKRDSIKPDLFNHDLIYTFSSGELSGNLDGWAQTIPASNGYPCFMIQAIAASNQETDSISASEWSEPIKFVEDGVSGDNGYNTAVVYLYKRTSETVSIDWRDELVYSFRKAVLEKVPNGWSTTIPDETDNLDDVLYVTAATFVSKELTDTIAYTEWSEPVVLAKNGAAGNNGTDGLNSATVFLYKRASSVPSKPTKNIVYTFATGAITDAEGWSVGVPSGSDPCYVIQATAVNRGASDTIASTEWTTPTILAQNGQDGKDGIDGVDGAHGMNTAVVYLYKRSATGASVNWSNSLTYSFADKSLTTVPTGWSKTIPDGTDPLYVTAATATSATETDTIAYTEWSEPVVLAKNGAAGNNGTDGLNSATVFLYKRASSVPSKPTKNIVYTFSTGKLSKTSGWSTSVPSGTNPCYVIHATAISKEATDVIGSEEWSTPALFVKNGDNGSDGNNTAIVYLYQRSATKLSVTWAETLTYRFSTKLLEAVPAGWSQSIPSGSDPVYVTMATAYGNTDTDTIDANQWCEPVVLAENGKDGTNGKDGSSSYMHIRYSEQSNGSSMSTIPTDSTTYIGVCTTKSATAPTTAASYTWMKFRGNDGVPGAPGTDGRTQYLHIKYSDDGETFTEDDGEVIGTYIGTLVDFIQEDSMTFSDYKWKQFTGDLTVDMEEIQNRIDDSADAIYDTIDQKEQGIRDKIEEETSGIRGAISNDLGTIRETIKSNYDAAMAEATRVLKEYRAEVGQYMEFGNSGLILGSSSSLFKTVIDNQGMYFKEGDAIVSYVKNNQLHIPNAVIESTMALGNFFFSPRSDGGVSLVWQDGVSS